MISNTIFCMKYERIKKKVLSFLQNRKEFFCVGLSIMEIVALNAVVLECVEEGAGQGVMQFRGQGADQAVR